MNAKPRSDGWSPKRQLLFLEVLRRTRNVSAAARAVRMSREGAYRLRRRPDAALFGAAWDQAMRKAPVTLERAEVDESHSRLAGRSRPTEGGNLRAILAAQSIS